MIGQIANNGKSTPRQGQFGKRPPRTSECQYATPQISKDSRTKVTYIMIAIVVRDSGSRYSYDEARKATKIY